ncbi:hypothetical protein Q0590_26170 [Rhodocytophaga aerolata]|uniref:Glycosyltransferase n=1 Tax=Rhodocytophaga aerolata TaxID=455078 RepID=A0ABT8RCG3_9BACT|nr:hypothetical protein [Rhodocytophaga aerolata]MDO1449792.1 hypothetical protein [Rhodocytophaga aerolata]
MIAIITSTLYPPSKPIFNQPRSSFTPNERITQTKQTILSLKEKGIKDIWLLDNSDSCKYYIIKDIFKEINVLLFDNYQFDNRGLSEIFLILNSLKYLPEDTTILKLSGRYKLNENFVINDVYDNWSVVVRGYNIGKNNEMISTRCYVVKNKLIYEELLLKTLTEMYRYPMRMVGLLSILKYFQKLYNPIYEKETSCSVEFAFSKVLKDNSYSTRFVKEIGLEGFIAGSVDKTFIKE